MATRKSSYAEFWPFYLQEHAKPITRQFHYIGTGLGIGIALYAIATQSWVWLLAIPLAGYVFAWMSHAFVERNRPATFTHPLWSLISDYRMFFLWLSGRLGPELDKAGVSRDGAGSPSSDRPSA
ncbi:MAG: DUF962 domain-containing protein [Pseudomonadota bacterium]